MVKDLRTSPFAAAQLPADFQQPRDGLGFWRFQSSKVPLQPRLAFVHIDGDLYQSVLEAWLADAFH